MSNTIILFATIGGISLATGALAFLLDPLQSDNSVIEVRTVCDIYGRCWTEAYPGMAIRRGIPRFEGCRVYTHEGYLYDPMSRRHYDPTRGRWVTDVGSVPIR